MVILTPRVLAQQRRGMRGVHVEWPRGIQSYVIENSSVCVCCVIRCSCFGWFPQQSCFDMSPAGQPTF